MSYAVLIPTAANIRAKFSELSNADDISDADIETSIEEALNHVDETWLPRFYTQALQYLTAHYVMVQISRQESASGQQVASETIGRIAISYATTIQPSAASPSDYTTTPYGTRFLELCELNFPAVAVI